MPGSYDEAKQGYMQAAKSKTDAEQSYLSALKTGDQAKIEESKKAMETAQAAFKEAENSYKSVSSAEAAAGNKQVQGKQPKTKFGQKMKEFGEGVVQGAKNATKTIPESASPSASALRDIAAGVKGQPTGNTLDAASGMMKELSDQSNKQATQHGMEAQQHQQIANRNEFGEGDKKAVASQAADVKQKINAAGAHGNQAGLLRMQNLNPDYNREQERQDQQRMQAEQQREKSSDMRRTAVTEQGKSQQYQLASRDYNNDVDESAKLSEGEGAKEEPEQQEETVTEGKPSAGQEENQQGEEQAQEEETFQQEEEQAQEEPAAQEPQEEEKQAEETPEEPKGLPSGNPQHVINYILGSSKGQDMAGHADEPLAKAILEKYSLQPVEKWHYKGPADTWEQQYIKDNGEPAKQMFNELRTMRAGGADKAANNYVNGKAEGSGEAMVDSAQMQQNPPSDERIKTIRKPLSREFWEELAGYDKPPAFKLPDDIVAMQDKVLSDARCKMILESLENGGALDSDDLEFLNSLQGNKFKFNDSEYDTGDMDSWDDSVLDGYAEHIKNYLYTYKPEAQSLDPEDEQLNPEQEHIGPMAQDIEKVNPACVKETPEGVKTVDTARLAMMNAGAIGDLARELKELKAVLGGL